MQSGSLGDRWASGRCSSGREGTELPAVAETTERQSLWAGESSRYSGVGGTGWVSGRQSSSRSSQIPRRPLRTLSTGYRLPAPLSFTHTWTSFPGEGKTEHLCTGPSDAVRRGAHQPWWAGWAWAGRLPGHCQPGRGPRAGAGGVFFREFAQHQRKD